MYFETMMHETRPVATASEAAELIRESEVRQYDALIWKAPSGRRLAVVADNHVNNPWLEVAVIDLDRALQIESISAGWCNVHELRTHFETCETTDFVFKRDVRLPLDGKDADAPADFECGCCGESFESTFERQKGYDQDNGYGICPSCSREFFGGV